MNNLEFIVKIFDNLGSIHSEIFGVNSSLLDNIQDILKNLYIVFHCNENFSFELDTNCNVVKPENIEKEKVMNYIYAHPDKSTNPEKKNEKLFLLSSIGFTKEKIVELKTFLEPFKTTNGVEKIEELLTHECSEELLKNFEEYINAAKIIKMHGGRKPKNTLNKKIKKQSNTFTKKNTK